MRAIDEGVDGRDGTTRVAKFGYLHDMKRRLDNTVAASSRCVSIGVDTSGVDGSGAGKQENDASDGVGNEGQEFRIESKDIDPFP